MKYSLVKPMTFYSSFTPYVGFSPLRLHTNVVANVNTEAQNSESWEY